MLLRNGRLSDSESRTGLKSKRNKPQQGRDGSDGKKAKVHAPSSFCDPFSVLPPEILEDIFLGLKNEEIFLSCSLVSKRWNRFLSSDLFWESLINREFGTERAGVFLQDKEKTKKSTRLFSLRQEIKFNHSFHSDFFGHLRRVVPVLQTQPDSLDEFIDSIRTMIQSDGDIDEPILFPFKTVYYERCWIIKLSCNLYGAVDLLRMPIVCVSSWFCDEIILLDANFNILSKHTQSSTNKNGRVVTIDNYPAGLRYIASNVVTRYFRFVFPSLLPIK